MESFTSPAAALEHAPNGISDNTMTDITDLLQAAARELKIGEMIHGPKFTLFEAMSALEMFDPKMDPRLGYAPKLTESDCEYQWPTESSAIEAIDRLLQCESYFYSGTTLLHSVLLCVWLHDCNQLTLPSDCSYTTAVRAYSLAVLRCVNRVIDALYSSDVVCEEDITLERFGFSLAEQFPSSYIVQNLDKVMCLFSGESQIKLRLQYRRQVLIAFEYLFTNNCINFRHAIPFLSSCIEISKLLNLDADETLKDMPYFDPAVTSCYLASCPPRPVMMKSVKQSIQQQIFLFDQLLGLSSLPAKLTSEVLIGFASAAATCLEANIIPRACLYLIGLSVLDMDPSCRLFLRLMSLNRSRGHRFTSKLFHSCMTLPTPDVTAMILIHHTELMLELELLSQSEYHTAFFVLDFLYSSLMSDSLSYFMQGCMFLSKGLFLAHVAFSSWVWQDQDDKNLESIFIHRFHLGFKYAPMFPSFLDIQKTISSLHVKGLPAIVDLAMKHFENSKSCFSKTNAIIPRQQDRAKRLATIAGCNAVSVKSILDKDGRHMSVRMMGDHTFPIIRWSSS